MIAPANRVADFVIGRGRNRSPGDQVFSFMNSRASVAKVISSLYIRRQIFVAAAIAWRYPITERRHKAILRALERRARRLPKPA